MEFDEPSRSFLEVLKAYARQPIRSSQYGGLENIHSATCKIIARDWLSEIGAPLPPSACPFNHCSDEQRARIEDALGWIYQTQVAPKNKNALMAIVTNALELNV